MKRSRFAEEQIIGILREHEAGGYPPQERDLKSDFLQLQDQEWLHGRLRRPAP